MEYLTFDGDLLKITTKLWKMGGFSNCVEELVQLMSL